MAYNNAINSTVSTILNNILHSTIDDVKHDVTLFIKPYIYIAVSVTIFVCTLLSYICVVTTCLVVRKQKRTNILP